ncbi:3D domain-containing protein [Jeotgalibaca sp. A122]|uniref:3D domain-containing protein n=1 Tax=Jeotgalibaca sp. A122 TaxID=3457322 RepID=UPI003FD1C5B8
MVKERKLGKLLVAALAAQMLFAAPIQASTLDKIQKQEQSKQNEISEIEVLVTDKLTSVNNKKAEVEELNAQIEDVEGQKTETLAEIEEQKALIAARKEQLEERLVALQTSSSTNSRMLMLMEAENFGDFLNLLLILGQLQSADNDRIELAIEEEQKLEDLETQLSEEIALIEEKSLLVDAESEILARELGSLQQILNENQAELEKIMADKTAEENRLAEVAKAEKVAAEKAAKEKAEADKIAAEKAASDKLAAENAAAEEAERIAAEEAAKTELVVETETETEVVENTVVQNISAPVVTETPAPSGRQVTVNATAYSRNQPSLSNHTFTGIDLRENPMVIAVDPSVIPLWSLVEIPGYGIYLAGDTGSAIIGNRIDIHMENLDSAWAFGRRQLTVTILN